MAAVLGFFGLLNPDFTLGQLGFEIVPRADRASHDYTTVFIMASSMAAVNMGAYYVLTAIHNLKKFYLWTAPFRFLTFTVFTLSILLGCAPGRFLTVAAWELIGAIATGVALYYERDRLSS
jgi:hypothetical protein